MAKFIVHRKKKKSGGSAPPDKYVRGAFRSTIYNSFNIIMYTYKTMYLYGLKAYVAL